MTDSKTFPEAMLAVRGKKGLKMGTGWWGAADTGHDVAFEG